MTDMPEVAMNVKGLCERRGIYIASKTAHGPRWEALRAEGVPIISTWINEYYPGATEDWADLWVRCVKEAAAARALVLYREPGETLKGAWLEAGAALAHGVPVFAVGIEEFNARHHPGITLCASLNEALTLAVNAPATALSTLSRELAEARAERDEAVSLNRDYEDALTDKRRLARELDAALHGDDNMAVQASLCDLVQPAKDLRARALAAEAAFASKDERIRELEVALERTDAARDVLAERQRQVTAEGWTPKHDDQHSGGEMARAASCYAAHASAWQRIPVKLEAYQAVEYCRLSPGWPWAAQWWKPTNPRRDLVKAGALILAEIERLDRARSTKEPT